MAGMELSESVLMLVALGAMVVTLALSFVPFLPVPAVLWAIGTVFAILTNFERATPAAIIVMTALLVVGSTSEVWMPLFGLRSKGLTCLSTLGSIAGSIAGTVVIPVPVVGTIIGAVAGALLVELVRGREVRRAMQAGRSVFQIYLIGMIVQFITGIVMFAVFAISLWTTR